MMNYSASAREVSWQTESICTDEMYAFRVLKWMKDLYVLM